MRFKRTAFLMLCVSISFVLVAERPAAAATFTVTKTADTADGVCDADCSLREAITASAWGDTIQFSSLFNTPQTITLMGTQLLIDKDLTISGTGADNLTVSGNNESRVFQIQELVVLSLGGMTITGGNADVGGGIFNQGSLNVAGCHITNNTAGDGGGIGVRIGSLTLRDSTISNNTAAARGGGISFDDMFSSHILAVINSTISGNTVTGVLGEGGGIWAVSQFSPAGVRIWNSTITNNFPGGVSAAAPYPGIDLTSSIVAANQNNSVVPDVDGGPFVAGGYSLIGNATGTGGDFDDGTNIIGSSVVQADPKLAPLAYNGGPTPTHELLPCSLAIDRGSLPIILSTDQRGFDRVRDGNGDGSPRADIGASEVQSFTPATCNAGPPTIDAANVVVKQGTMGNCPTCPWFDIATVSDPDGLFGLGILIASPNPSNGVRLSNISMLSGGVFSAQIAASCTASDANFALTVGDGGFLASDTLTVTVTPETTPPVVVLRTEPITLFPNDHKYLTLSMSSFIASASDNCDSSVNLLNSAVITQVISDEPDNALGKSDGNTVDDIVIAPDCKSVQLRAERDSNGDGRVYTITLRVRDASGNATTATRKVSVPLSQNGNPAIESAPQYTLTSSCA